MHDNVNHPQHYTDHCSMECIDVMKMLVAHYSKPFVGFLVGNAFKYMWRYKYKGNETEDLQKANWYLDRVSVIDRDKTVKAMKDYVDAVLLKIQIESKPTELESDE